jgi:hypothetical protein
MSAGLLAGGHHAGAATPAESTAARSVFTMLNAERAANRLPALGWSDALVASAHRHNLSMAAANSMQHVLPGEVSVGQRISAAGVPWRSYAENIGWNTDRSTTGANYLQQLMYGERPPQDGHRRNILSTQVRYVGIDIYIDARTGKLWLTEDFADAAGPAAPRVVVDNNPFGHFDTARAIPGRRVALAGWAVDPNNRSAPLKIAVYYDGRGLGWFSSPVVRPDVARAVRSGPMQGYRITATLPPGRHTVCTYAINIGPGSVNPRLGCATVVT